MRPFLITVCTRLIAKAIPQVAIIGHRQDQQIGLFARLQRADAVGAADGGRGVDRGGGDRLGRGQAHIAAGQRHGKLHILTPGRAGVQIGGNGQQPAGLQDRLGRGILRLRQAKGRAGQRHRHRIAARQRLDILRRGLHQVIGRNRLQFGRQLGAAQVVELIGVDFERKAQVSGAVLKICRDCSRVKAPVSQKTSTKGIS